MPGQIPQPQTDSDSQEYWAGLAQHELRIQQCAACSHYVFYPRSICPHCYTEQLKWVTATGAGTIYSYTVVHQGFGPYAEDVPFIIAVVELAEGVRMLTRIVDAPREKVKVGAAVQVTFAAVGADITLPYFQLVA